MNVQLSFFGHRKYFTVIDRSVFPKHHFFNPIAQVLATLVYVASNHIAYSTNFKCGLGLERGPPSLVRTIG